MCNFLEYKGMRLLFDAYLLTLDAIFRALCHVCLGDLIIADGPLSWFFRYQGRIQAIRFPFLCVWNLCGGQRTRDTGNRPSLRRSLGSIFRECESSPPTHGPRPET